MVGEQAPQMHSYVDSHVGLQIESHRDWTNCASVHTLHPPTRALRRGQPLQCALGLLTSVGAMRIQSCSTLSSVWEGVVA